MDKDTFINLIILEWASKSSNGLITEEYSESDLEVLHEIVINQGIGYNEAVDFVNDVSILSEKGKHPERQAYNRKGILVTFPTPEYKARALAKGTHFEKDPRASQSNLFGGGQQTPNGPAPSTPVGGSEPSMDAKDTSLPQSDSGQSQTPPAQKEVPEPGTPGGEVPSSPSSPSGGGGGGGVTSTPAQGQLATEPAPQATPSAPNVSSVPTPPTPPAVQKTPEEIAAEKLVIKQMLDTDDTLPTVPGVGGPGIAETLNEELQKLRRVALDMNLKKAVRFLSKHL
jgi:hypothetical protein